MFERIGMAVSRRRLLGAGLATAAGSFAAAAMGKATPSQPAATNLALDTGEGNARLMARITANLDGTRIKHGWYRGRVMGAAPGAAVRDLLGIMGMSSQRALPDLRRFAACG